jgi:hypothetical protein
MDAIIGIAFLLSGYTNGADLSFGFGFAEKQDQFINPVGIIELSTSLYDGGRLKLDLNFSHFSSIPDSRDNWLSNSVCPYWETCFGQYDPYSSDLNMISIMATVKFRGAK